MTMALDYAHTMPEYTTNSNPELTDQIAIASDWRAVGNDLAYAISEIEL